MSSYRERDIERRLAAAVKKHGGLCPKFVSPGTDGVPDRIVLMPGGRLAFVEVKTPGMTLRPLQVQRKRQLELLGFKVYVLDAAEQIDEILKAIGGDAE